MSRVLHLSATVAGERLDRFLAAAPTDLSRSALQALIRSGHVRVNGREARPALRLRAGDAIELVIPPAELSPLEPEDLPLAVVHEDADLVVLDKPAGLVVHPGAGVPRGTLVQALLHRYPEIAAVGGAGRPGVVHRLDKDTSGLMVVARSQRAYLSLVEAIRVRAVERVYDALVWGRPALGEGTVDIAVGRDPGDRRRMAALTSGGKPARTHWTIAEELGPWTLLRVRLDTGRTHQIRVHMAHLGHPVVGDAAYGGRVKKLLSLRQPQRSLAAELLEGLGRQALHASALRFPHPVTGQPLAFTVPWPEDISRAIDLLRERLPRIQRLP